MVRGTTTFKCDNCSHKFEGLDIEWRATAYSCPQQCPKCGSYHTYPDSMFSFFSKHIYKNMWTQMDKDN